MTNDYEKTTTDSLEIKQLKKIVVYTIYTIVYPNMNQFKKNNSHLIL